jgi:hypothetical protein
MPIFLICNNKNNRAQANLGSTYQFSQDVDFVEEHFLLVVVHVALPQNFDGSLSSSISVHAHSHLSKGTYTT